MSAAPTKEELEEKAKQLETRLDDEIAKVKATRPQLVHELEHQKNELKVISAELEKATQANVVASLENRLNRVEEGIERELARIDGRTGTPGTRPTGRPTRPQRTTEPVTESSAP